MKITPARDPSPPWTIFAESSQHPTHPRKCLVVLPAGRPGDVADVEDVPDGVVLEVVRSVNAGTMTVDDALAVFELHKEKARGDDAIGSRPDSFAPELVDVLRQVRAIIAREKK